MSIHAVVVISPATTTMPVFTSVSHATRAVRVLREDRVEDGVGDRVADLVGMAFGDGLGRELITAHSGSMATLRRQPIPRPAGSYYLGQSPLSRAVATAWVATREVRVSAGIARFCPGARW